MAIYTVYGAPVDIVEAEQRRRWGVSKPGRYDTYDAEPTPGQRKGAKRVEQFDLWWVRAKQTGAYPDGSGVSRIGKMIEGRIDLTKRGFIPETELRADDGIREIHRECEMKRDDRKAKLKVASDANKELSRALFG